jgi:heme A synthase
VWLLCFYAYFNRASSIFFFVSCMMIGILNEMLKVYYMDGRPFYLVDGIKGYDCSLSNFGRPASHNFITCTVFFLWFLSYFDTHDVRGSAELLYRNQDGSFEEHDKETQHNKNRHSSFFFALSSILLGFLVILGWVYDMLMGANTFDQVVFGTSISVGFTVVLYALRDEMSVYFIQVSEHVYEMNHKIRILAFFLIGTIFFIVIMYGARTYIIYEFNRMEDVPPEWVQAFEQQCGKPMVPHWFYYHLR